MDDKGWVILPVLTSDECDNFIDAAWQWVENGFGVVRGVESTYKRWPYSIRGLIQHYEAAQQQFCWDVRLKQSVIQAFASVFLTEDLLVSFDGICFTKPNHKLRNEGAVHVDQPSGLPAGRRSVQGIVFMTDANEQNGTLKVWEGSHLHHNTLNLPNKGGLHCLSTQQIIALQEGGSRPHVVHAPRGHILLWDSRLVHQGLIPSIGCQRICQYISFQPKEFATSQDISRKQKYFREYRVTTHAASEGVQAFPKSARHMQSADVPLESLRTRQTSPHMLQLAGF